MKVFESTLAVSWAALAAAVSLAGYGPSNGEAPLDLECDVAVIGGGASGAYAAARLHQQGIKVLLIEQKDKLGGHVSTYRDPVSKRTFDYGVQIFSNISVVTDFFAHYDVPLVRTASPLGASQTVDFTTGEAVSVVQNLTATGQALQGYAAQVAKYPTLKDTWDIPNPVPQDLLLSLGDFIQKYSLQAWTGLANQFNQGLGNILSQTTLYILRFFDLQQISDIGTANFVANALQNNQLLYDRVQAELGDSVLLNTEPLKVQRYADSVEILASNGTSTQRITARKLLISVPPTARSLSFLDTSPTELSLFSQFNASCYWNSIILNTGLPENITYVNAAPQNPLGLPASPSAYMVGTNFPGTYVSFYGSPYDLPDEVVKAEIIATVKRIRAGLNITTDKEPVVSKLNAHNPFHLTVSNKAIEQGFYEQLEALQGQKNTWFTGRAWNRPATSALWNFTEYEILPKILAELQ